MNATAATESVANVSSTRLERFATLSVRMVASRKRSDTS